MTTEVKLKAERRQEHGKEAARRLRAQGRVPAVLYGRGSEAVSLSLDAHETTLLFQSISVENTIVGLEISGERGPVKALVREVQVHPYRARLHHVDFYRIREGEKIEVEVPVHLTGQAEGVRNGGVLQQALHSVRVSCLPASIPDVLELDVAGLEIGQSAHVSDLRAGEGVEILADADQVVCSVMVTVLDVPEPEAAAEEPEEAEGEPAGDEGAGEGGEEGER